MTVILETNYALPGGDEPLTHARIAHSGNWVTGGTVNTSGTDTGFFAEGPDNSLTYEKWKDGVGTVALWTYTFGSAQTIDYCVIGAHDCGDQGALVQVQVDTGTGFSNIGTQATPTDNSPIFAIFEPRSLVAARVRFSSFSSQPTVGVIKFGKALQMQRPIYGGHSPLDMARMTTMRSSQSSTGEWLGRTKLRTMFQTEFAWSNLTAQWIRDNWRDFQLAIETEPFFIAWRPDTFGEVGLCYTNETPVPQNQGVRDLMAVSLTATGYGYD